MIDIKNIDGSVIFSVLPDENAVFHEELMTSDYVKLSWDFDVYKVIPAGAYIEYEGEKYKLLDNYSPTQQDECTYQYTPQFQSRIMNWDKQITPVYTYEGDGTTVKSREMDWEFTGSPADAMYIVKQAIKNETGEDWTIQLAESLPATITISSQSASIFATLNTIAGECDTEWWADKKTNTLYLSKCIFGDAVKLEVGDNVQVPTVTNDSEGYFTRFYAFGSTRNITQDYDGGQATNSIVNKRLTLNPTKYPNGYKDIKEGLNQDEVFVKVLYFDDIYPSSKLTISDVRARLKYRLDNNGQKIRIGGTDSEPIYEQYAIWYFQIAGFTFDPSTDVIEGLNLSASFESGQLAGRDFELTYHKTASTVNDAADVTAFNIKAGDYEIVIDESSGTIIPGTSYIIPQDGDSLVLFNIIMPDEYVTSAQDELEKALDKAMLSYTEDNNSYQMASDPTRFYENNTDIQMGQAVTFVNGSKSLSTRVQMVEKRLDLNCYQTIKVGNKIIKGNTQQLKDEVASVNQNLDVIKAFNELSFSLSQAYANAQREMIEGFASIKNLWTLETDEQGNKYAYTEYDIFGKCGITAYTSGKPQVPSIFDGLPLDNVTIWKNPSTGLIEVIGGTGGGSDFDSSKMWELLGAATSEQINISHLTNALSGYAVKATTLAGYGITDAYTKTDSDSLYRRVGGTWKAATCPGTREFGFVSNNGAGEVSFSFDTSRGGVLNMSIDGDIYCNDAGYKVWHAGNGGSGSGLDADLLDGLHSSRFPIYYNLIMSSTSNYWYKLGTARIYESHSIIIHIYGGNGWNSDASQNAYATLMIKSGDPRGGLTREFGATMVNHHHSNMTYKLISPSNDTVDIWVKMPWAYSNGWYSIHGGYDSYTHSGSSQSAEPTGNVQTGVETLTNAYTSSNVASATRLQTPRTIWGQSFNGEQNVSGTLTGVTGITSSGSYDTTSSIILRHTVYNNKNIITWSWDSTYGDCITFNIPGNNNQSKYMILSSNKGLNLWGNFTTDGNILATGGITCYSSDARAKTIVEELNLSLKQISESPTIRFKWNGWKIKDDGKTHIGGIAQYVQKLLPECVLDTDDFLNLDYSTTAYIYSVQTARHLRKYETKTDKEIRKLEKEIVYLKQQLKSLGYEESDTLVN